MEKDFSEYIKNYRPKNYHNIYYDKNLFEGGIDYQKFIKLRLGSIKNSHIKNVYGIDGWYVLWYLMKESYYNMYYIDTDMFMLCDKLNFDIKKLKAALTKLIESKTIIVYHNNKKISVADLVKFREKTIIEIIVSYNMDEYYPYEIDLYFPIQLDFIQTVFNSLSPNQLAIYTTLIGYNDFNANSNSFGYAYPTLRQISEKIGISHVTIKKELETLLENKYNLIKIINNKSYINGKVENNKYIINLLNRIEYIYYARYNSNIKESVESKYGIIFNQYKQALENNNVEWYANNKTNMSMTKYRK